MGKLVLMDGMFLPMEGTYGFEELLNSVAKDGICQAMDGDALVNKVRDKDAAEYLSRLVGRRIPHDPRLSEQGEATIEEGDAFILLPYYTHRHLSMEWRRKIICGVSFDIISAAGLASRICQAKPPAVFLEDWIKVVAEATRMEHTRRLAIQKEREADV